MATKTLLLGLLMLGTLLAGCSDDDAEAPQEIDPSEQDLLRGKGAIEGLLVDDRFRPIEGGTILLQPVGQTAKSNGNGEFLFLDLEPGAYTMKVAAEGHEASPQTVNVAEGEFSEANVVARRIVNEAGSILTQEYSVFIPCSVDFVVNGIVFDCTGDQSGESFRAAFTTDYTDIDNVTYLITEMQANQEGRWEIQIRASNETSSATDRYAVPQFEGDYVKVTNQVGVANHDWENEQAYGANVPFDNAWPFDTILFTDSEGREELQDGGAPVCCGAGATTGIKAKFVQSVFIGAPEVDVASYCVMC